LPAVPEHARVTNGRDGSRRSEQPDTNDGHQALRVGVMLDPRGDPRMPQSRIGGGSIRSWPAYPAAIVEKVRELSQHLSNRQIVARLNEEGMRSLYRLLRERHGRKTVANQKANPAHVRSAYVMA
jgi:hypothetical protein